MAQPIIKKDKTRNQYLLTASGLWVRDMNQICVPVDINKFTNQSDIKLMIDNEVANMALKISEMSVQQIDNAVIISDGFNFVECQQALSHLPKNVFVIGVNGALCKWNVSESRRMDCYFVNNPYKECMQFFPKHTYRPKCICSIRTYNQFIKRYNGAFHYYIPTLERFFGVKYRGKKSLDDYRNPICGAISFLSRCKVKRLALLSCDDVFKIKRPGANQLDNGLWMYPQHYTSHQLIDGMLYWLSNREIEAFSAVNCSMGPKYDYAKQINLEELLDFFK